MISELLGEYVARELNTIYDSRTDRQFSVTKGQLVVVKKVADDTDEVNIFTGSKVNHWVKISEMDTYFTKIKRTHDDPEGSNKFKMFRNYMVNELGVTRQDIETWTKEATITQVRNSVGHMDFSKLVDQSIDTHVKKAIMGGSGWGSGSLSKELKKDVIEQIMEGIDVTISSKNT